MFKSMIRKHKYLPLIVGVLILLIASAVIVPMNILAAGNDTPQKFTLWHPASSESPDDASITLRFAFTIGTSTNGTAGIVYSFTNPNPTIGGSGCTKKVATVYPANHYLTWHSSPMNPGSGRRWAWVETNTIQKARYTDPIYVRAYIQTSSGTTYSSVMNTSVWGAFIADFKDGNFGGANVTTDLFAAAAEQSYLPAEPPIEPAIPSTLPPVYPTEGQHPRVLFTESDIPGINTALANAPARAGLEYTDENNVKRTADGVNERYRSVMDNPPDGKLPNGQYRSEILNNIQLVALLYQMTGNKTHGYRAILALKNVFKTMGSWTMDDRCRNFGHVMYTAACVYDWCYDLLTSTDKQQIVAGVQHKCCEPTVSVPNIYHYKTDMRMEIGFPPSVPGAFIGHGAEFQLLRDYLAFAIAIYDDYPGWWDYIAGRFYEDYVPVRNEFYNAGLAPQGVSLYFRIRFTSDLYSALLIKTATGTFPYESEAKMQQVMRTFYAHELPRREFGDGQNAFDSGDNHTFDRNYQDHGRASLIESHLFQDRTARKQLERVKWSYSAFDDHITMRASVAEYLICSSSGVSPAGSSREGIPLILYNGGWLGQLIARKSWLDNQAAVLMKIGERNTAGHDHADAGQFQIWYKGMLAGDTGSYDHYSHDGSNDPHFKFYHQATVAHNCILIDNEGQKQPPETGNFNNGGISAWLTSDKYKTGTVTGLRYGYKNNNTAKPRYAYIAGDLTPAYDETGKVNEYNRRMLAVFDTNNDNVPLFFFVYDNLSATNDNYQKTFLLHVPNEPSVNGRKMSVVNDHGGKLVLQNVFGSNTIVKDGLGGVSYYLNDEGEQVYDPLASRNYVVNGSQVAIADTHYDEFWGRIEIRTTSNEILNTMYVCDQTYTTNLTATSISNSTVKGAILGDVAAVFVSSSTLKSTAFSFNPGSSGTKTFYVSGVKSGTWTVKRNGTVIHETVTASGGLLVFDATASGTIELTPSSLIGVSAGSSLGNGSWSSVSFSSLH